MSDVFILDNDPPDVRCNLCLGVARSMGCCQSRLPKATAELSAGDIFASGCEALVNPVCCAGVQGAGLALQFAKRYRAQCDWYRRNAMRIAQPGAVYHVTPLDETRERNAAALHLLSRRRARPESPPLVLFATTKAHFSRPSQLRWIIGCLAGLVEVVEALVIQSVAVPMLGCGLGGLAPDVVRPQLLAAAERMPCRVVLFGPR